MQSHHSAQSELVAVLGRGGTAYLYRVADSIRPVGVGLYSEVEPAHGSVVRLNIIFPWSDTLEVEALVHWSARVTDTLSIIGLKLHNPDEAVTEAMTRAATVLPVFNYDDAKLS